MRCLGYVKGEGINFRATGRVNGDDLWSSREAGRGGASSEAGVGVNKKRAKGVDCYMTMDAIYGGYSSGGVTSVRSITVSQFDLHRPGPTQRPIRCT